MRISIGSDHAGYFYKTEILKHLLERGHEVQDHGCYSNESVDYPDFIHPVALDLDLDTSDFGIILCGSGNGAAITANKHKKVRCALCWTAEITQLARQHNDANILSIPARFVSKEQAIHMVDLFLSTSFEGGRHQTRVNKIQLA